MMKASIGLIVGLAVVGIGAAACGSNEGSATSYSPDEALHTSTISQNALSQNALSQNALSTNKVAGEVSTLSLYSDGSGGVGILCVGLDANGRCNDVPVALAALNCPSGASCDAKGVCVCNPPQSPVEVLHRVRVLDASIPGTPWSGRFGITLNPDGTAQGSIVQLVDFNGIETVGAYSSANGSPWVDMMPSTTFVCLTDTDCTLYGLDTANGPYTCANNVCQQSARVPVPCQANDVSCGQLP